RASPDSLIPEETVCVARVAFPQGNSYIQPYDTLGPIESVGWFADLFSQTGQPAEAPARLALVPQCAEGLSDLQAVDAVRGTAAIAVLALGAFWYMIYGFMTMSRLQQGMWLRR